ncbi:glycosyltransferase family 2 protein [Bernardetia sp.]|uniref:glycosyltransferase family 2 protein n=1 Tax=Bernardetia sp. TaxID=1937974 RepID=UPI0025C2496C|nr:glycosyltransferase family 2 protein [Bernardetia sp.]
MNLPKITVVTPSFNQGNFIEETIDSILSQEYPNLEYIIIDGKSTDNTVEIIKKYEKHLAYWVSEKDKGQSEAINKGMRKSTGDILTWICSDDLLLENALPNAANHFLENPSVSLIHGKTKTFGEGYSDQITAGYNSDLSIDYFTHMCFPQPSSFFKRNIFEKQSYDVNNHQDLVDESLHYSMDYDLLLRIALNYEIMQVEDVFSAYRLHPESKTVSQQSKFEIEKDKVFLRLLYTLKSNEKAIKGINILKNLGIDSNEQVIYNIDEQIIQSIDIDKIVAMFLYRKIPVAFENKAYQHVIEYCEAIKDNYSNFYNSLNLDSMYQTSKYNSLSAMGKLGWKFKKLI